MKILILVSSLNTGGAEKQAVTDANLLSKCNDVFLGIFKGGPLIDQLNKEVKLIYFKKKSYFLTAYNLSKFVKSKSIQIINASLFAPMNIAALSTLFKKTSILWHFHSHEYDSPFSSRLSFKILAHLRNVKKIIFVSKELKEFFSKNGFRFPKEKMKVLYNSCNYNTGFRFEEVRSNKFIIGYVGRLVSLKRVHYLMELASYLIENNFKNFEIHIIGDGIERIELEKYTQVCNMEKSVKFLGFISDTMRFYKKFDIFVMPSEEECLSISLIDAGMFGIPAVAFDVGGNKEIIKDGISGFIVKSKKELFEKSMLLCKDKELRISLGKSAREFCKNKFSPEIRLEKLLHINEECSEN